MIPLYHREPIAAGEKGFLASPCLIGSELKLELSDRHSGIKTLGARSCTVEDSVASVHTQLVL